MCMRVKHHIKHYQHIISCLYGISCVFMENRFCLAQAPNGVRSGEFGSPNTVEGGRGVRIELYQRARGEVLTASCMRAA